MTPVARLVATVLFVGASAPLAAQSNAGDPVRLDDFAVAQPAASTLEVQQVTGGAGKIDTTAQPHDRSTGDEQPTGLSSPAVAQLSSGEQGAEQAQLSNPGGRPDTSAAAVSSPAQSRPQGVQRLSGVDRCDPQLGGAELARCRQILELRAQEFHAPAAPQLSPEQALLAQQQLEDDAPARLSGSRLRLASRSEPDADLQSNQELAAIYLDKQTPPTPPPEEKAAAVQDSLVSQILGALHVGGTGAPPPN